MAYNFACKPACKHAKHTIHAKHAKHACKHANHTILHAKVYKPASLTEETCLILVETAVLGCHFQIICFGLKVGLEVEWARLEFRFH